MARYQYRHTIRSGDTVIRGAFFAAEKAHEKQWRGKIDPQWKYICHPIMVYDILQLMGEKDPVVLSAALLHDALEKGSKFHQQPQELHRYLQNRMQNLGGRGKDGNKFNRQAYEIMRLVSEVTNPEEYGVGKEMEQIDRAAHMSLAAKKIKIADQTASLICNLTMANDPQQFKPAQERNFTAKATSLVSAIAAWGKKADDADREAGRTPENQEAALQPYHHLYGRVLKQVEKLFAARDREAAELVRDGVDFQSLVSSKRAASVMPLRHTIVDKVMLDGSPRVENAGVAELDLDRHGRIVSFVMHEADNEGVKHPVNALQHVFIQAVRAASHLMHEPLQTGDQVVMLRHGNTQKGRRYTLNCNAELFISRAKTAGVISDRDEHIIRDAAMPSHGYDEGQKRRWTPPEGGGGRGGKGGMRIS